MKENNSKHINRLILGLSLFILPIVLITITQSIGWKDFFKTLFNLQLFLIGAYIEGFVILKFKGE